jgi:hypothetical protein
VATDIIMVSKLPSPILRRLIYIELQNSADFSSGKCFQLFLVECIVVPTRIASDVTCLSLLIFCSTTSDIQEQSVEMANEGITTHALS